MALVVCARSWASRSARRRAAARASHFQRRRLRLVVRRPPIRRRGIARHRAPCTRRERAGWEESKRHGVQSGGGGRSACVAARAIACSRCARAASRAHASRCRGCRCGCCCCCCVRVAVVADVVVGDALMVSSAAAVEVDHDPSMPSMRQVRQISTPPSPQHPQVAHDHDVELQRLVAVVHDVGRRELVGRAAAARRGRSRPTYLRKRERTRREAARPTVAPPRARAV